ncbi:putative transposase [Mycobacterium ulcerans str. Harvey]|uniref:Transposase n=1 Tax=Mycobacterium ulcerans str. Harvey TaxID=1299332 RepID=A0ABN0RA99_MYCUL|nr:putative transposase [Mycobacterium ulcerans str. Harvey]
MTAWHTAARARIRRGVHRRLHVKIRDGKSAPAGLRRGRVDLAGHRDVLGMWAVKVTANRPSTGCSADGVEKPRRGRHLLLVCDASKTAGLGERGLPTTVVQTCIIHLIRGTFRYPGASTTPRSPGAQADLHRGQRCCGRRSLRCLRHRMGHRYQRQFDCGAPPGMSSSHSWTTTPR